MAAMQGQHARDHDATVPSPQATRVESLFHLVKEGSSLDVRANAAEKLGEIALQSPVYCRSILQQIRLLLVDTQWDVRVAAATCVDVIARSFQTERLLCNRVALRFANASFAGRAASCPRLSVRTVSIETVLRDGAPLLRSGGEEYQYQSNLSEDQRRVQAVRQRQLLLRRICGASADQLWKTGEDSLAQQMLPRLNVEHVKELAEDIEASESTMDLLNKELVQDTRKRALEMLPDQSRAVKKIKTEADGSVKIDEPSELGPLDCLALLVSDLFESIFDSKWEVRHGGFAALRNILLSSGLIDGINRQRHDVDETGERRVVDQWIEESLIRCLCVLALDQFVDYSADGSVAPVRELTAQVFGILLGSLQDQELLQEYIGVLRKLLGAASWHTAHGGLLGIKYLLQAHGVHAPALVPLIVDDVVSMLETKRRSAEEDVLVVASSILGNIVPYLNSVASSTLRTAACSLWSIVTAARTTGSFVSSSAIHTLQLWYEYAPVANVINDHSDPTLEWDNLMRIVPLLHLDQRSVRVSTATCIEALIGKGDRRLKDVCSNDKLGYLLSHLLLQVLSEEENDVRRVLLSCWASVIHWCRATGRLAGVVEDQVTAWIELLWTLDRVGELDIRVEGTTYDSEESTSSSLPSKENLAARIIFAEALGVMLSQVPHTSRVFQVAIERTTDALHSQSGEQQCGSLLLLYWWTIHSKKQVAAANEPGMALALREQVGATVEVLAQRDWVPALPSAQCYYSEQAASLQRVLRMQQRLVEIFQNAHIHAEAHDTSSTGLCPSAASVSRTVAERIAQYPFSKLSAHPQDFEQAHFCRQDLFLIDDVIQKAFSSTYARVQGLGSCVYCELLVIPTKKSGFLVKSLMESIKTEANSAFRALTAETLASFVVSQVDVQRKCVAKIVSNLCNSAVALAYRENNADEAITGDTLHSLQVRIEGAEKALQAIVQALESFDGLPLLSNPIRRGWSPDGDKWTDRMIQENSRLISVLLPSLPQRTKHFAVTWMDELSSLIGQAFEFERTRQAVASALAQICGMLSQSECCEDGEAAMAILYQKLFSGHSQHIDGLVEFEEPRQLLAGSMMVVDRLVVEMGSRLTPYVPSLLHFAMKAMHAAETSVRSMAAKVFADLVPLLPLQMDLSCSEVRHPHLKKVFQENQASRAFLESLLQGKAIRTVSVSAVLSNSFTLREYQQHGINWLAFIAENQMGAVLADDMGLGKTLQILATIATTVSKSRAPTLSLVVCPPIVVHHWIAEAKRCFPGVFSDLIDYSGPAAKRKTLLDKARKAGGSALLVTTYSTIRTDRNQLEGLMFDFVVLDEAHLIRNPKSALFDAVCSLQSSHRFALSGTPLQNHVGDLWALFTFLMPGYLGDYAEFRRDFELPISRSRERNATPKQKEMAAHAINTLHQRVLPFILRRTKDEVLKELPPKIISNVLLPFTPMQQRMYKAIAKSSDEDNAAPISGVLRHLQLLKKVCVHPALVKDGAVLAAATASEKTSLSSWKHSGKMVGLHDLLVESCDLGREENDSDDCIGRGHRCLVFAHHIETLDVIQDMLTQALPKVTSLRLDGKTPVPKRQNVVTKFNEDPSIDLLLITTAVGGLGLTLTGADTVIFVEHSWNPFVDLQAMDRAHRMGQKKTVRVFRLIMEGSLEEHIMDLQAFKEQVANTVVTSTEASTSMNANTKNVLHLLKTSSTAVKAQEAAALAEAEQLRATRREDGDVGIPGVAVELLNQIGELWDQSQYDSLEFPTTQ